MINVHLELRRDELEVLKKLLLFIPSIETLEVLKQIEDQEYISCINNRIKTEGLLIE